MKELEVKIALRNNRLKERRETLGFAQRQFAEAVGVSHQGYVALETMRHRPMTRSGEWRGIALRLAEFHCCEPDELWPDAVLAITQSEATRKVDVAELASLASASSPPLLGEPGDRSELRRAVQSALGTLTERQARVLRLRFGLDGGSARTLESIGRSMRSLGLRAGGISPERVREIEAKALRILRHPSRSKQLKDFLVE